MRQIVKAITNALVARPYLTRTMNSTPPQTPSRPRIDHSRTKGTPRRRKTPSYNKKPGIKKSKRSIQEIKAELKRILKLSFTPDEWQAHLIQRVQDGYDSIFCAGTGYGKSIIFEGIAALGGQRKVTIVISPLKSLQKDQVSQLAN
jgi:superfamily II DNA helicase RecQ